jgi:hypothetical protein
LGFEFLLSNGDLSEVAAVRQSALYGGGRGGFAVYRGARAEIRSVKRKLPVVMSSALGKCLREQECGYWRSGVTGVAENTSTCGRDSRSLGMYF